MRYTVIVASKFEIHAENIAHARRLARGLRTIGAGSRWERSPHDRDGVTSQITHVETRAEVKRVTQ